ncbi:hypothetical protein HaLaN_20778, partial [Haematococcus lacustris]
RWPDHAASCGSIARVDYGRVRLFQLNHCVQARAIVACAEYWSAVAQAFAPVWLDAVQSPK